MKKKLVMKFTDESSVTFQLSVSGPGEFGHKMMCLAFSLKNLFKLSLMPLYYDSKRYCNIRHLAYMWAYAKTEPSVVFFFLPRL